MDRRGFEAERAEDHAEIRRENARRIVARPELVLETLTRTEAVFSRHDMAREVSRHIDDAEQFRMVLARLDASPELVRLSEGSEGGPARLTTREMVAAETRMMEAAAALAAEPTHGVSRAAGRRRAAGRGRPPVGGAARGGSARHRAGAAGGGGGGYAGTGKSAIAGGGAGGVGGGRAAGARRGAVGHRGGGAGGLGRGSRAGPCARWSMAGGTAAIR